MTKTFHFMAGLPRSGSTVLSALLNQHPEVYASPQTDLVNILYDLNQNIPTYESYKANLLHSGYQKIMTEMPKNFYSDIEKPVIIDKNRGWGTPYNFTNLSPLLNKDGKVILTMRPILEVLASFAKVFDKTEKKLGQAPFLYDDLWVSHYRSKSDAQIDNLMQLNNQLDRSIFSVANLLKNHKDRVLVVWYDDLVESPKETLNKVYSFLEVQPFVNNLSAISETDKHDDLGGYGLLGLHDLQSKLHSNKTKPEDYLSDYVIKKYKNALDFLEL